jgi:ABC-2 type transport system ATP-binding protein/sodium transport system ATP-binding protein
LITAENLTKRFPRKREDIVAVNDVSFAVPPGEVFGLLGPNGAGKTTTLRMILGLLEPTSGRVCVDGYDVAIDPNSVKQRIGYASASVGVYPWLSTREMLSFVGDLYNMNAQYAETRIDELAKLLDFSGLLDRRCATLSTGEKQRVNLARALIHEPPVMLMDEPTNGLDVIGSKTIFDYVSHLRLENKAVIVCTHRLDEAERLCDRFGLLHKGLLYREGTIDDLLGESKHSNLTDLFLEMLSVER